ncbi:hypothetical protein [uncultured Fibrobacter sp.]|uniref:hypothetical protein n=1 Tax=uncultured Fibrobacter sp. TaxID=261512 RepID=UPI0025E6DA36|nr:hypothetical protein [uncultured Fibrobacter sp.]
MKIMFFVLMLFFVACSGTQCTMIGSKKLCFHDEPTYTPNKLRMQSMKAKRVHSVSDENHCKSFFNPDEFNDSLFGLVDWSPSNCDGGDTSYVFYVSGNEDVMLEIHMQKYFSRDSVESAFLEHIGIDRKTLLDAARKLRD